MRGVARPSNKAARTSSRCMAWSIACDPVSSEDHVAASDSSSGKSAMLRSVISLTGRRGDRGAPDPRRPVVQRVERAGELLVGAGEPGELLLEREPAGAQAGLDGAERLVEDLGDLGIRHRF